MITKFNFIIMAYNIKGLNPETAKIQKKLEEHLLGVNRGRIKFMVFFIVALLTKCTVGFYKLASVLLTGAKISSNQRTIQRFFANYDLDLNGIYKLLFALLPDNKNIILCLDRTNWKLGKSNINILMLSVAYKGLSIPILWTLLDKQGNSNTAERIAIMEKFIGLFGRSCIKYLLADREFIGCKWLKYLKGAKISFYIRVKENAQVKTKNGKKMAITRFFSFLKLNVYQCNNKIKTVYGVQVFISSVKRKNEKGEIEIVVIISDIYDDNSVEKYKERWQIETMFKAFKTNGFNLEDTHLTELERINKLIALLSIAYTWAYIVGIWKHENYEEIKIKKHGRRAHSFFAYGLAFLINAIICRKQNFDICVSLLEIE